MATITDEPLDPATCLVAVGSPACGGLAVFVGVVRDNDGDREVSGLFYEAHPSAAAQLVQVCERALAFEGVHRVAVCHRVGDLVIGDAAVVVAVSTPHRAEAFTACRWLIDTLKAEVPIWKQEHYVDGGAAWVGCP